MRMAEEHVGRRASMPVTRRASQQTTSVKLMETHEQHASTDAHPTHYPCVLACMYHTQFSTTGVYNEMHNIVYYILVMDLTMV